MAMTDFWLVFLYINHESEIQCQWTITYTWQISGERPVHKLKNNNNLLFLIVTLTDK